MATLNGARVADTKNSLFKLGTQQEVTIGAASASCTNAVGATTLAVRLCATVDCRIVFAATPTALATSTLLPALCPEYFEIEPGFKVAVIQESAAGKLSITEVL